MVKPFNLDKFRRSVTKSTGITDGYHDPKTWVSTRNFALNKLISGSFYRGIPLGKVSVLAGESGSGKSYIAVGCVMKEAMEKGILCVLLDSEFAIDAQWLQKAGIDPHSELLMRFPVSQIDECANIVNDFMNQYLNEYAEDERPPVLFIMDSLGMLSTPTEVDQFKAGDMKGDMGRKAKQLKAFVTQCLKMFGPHQVGLLATNHVYASQNAYAPDDVISGGSGFIFASTVIVTMNKLKLKLDEFGNKVTDVRGIRSKIKVAKSRYSKPFEEIEMHIPYATGMSPYNALFDYLLACGTLVKDGQRYAYKHGTEDEIKLYKKEWLDFEKSAEHLDLIMRETDEHDMEVAEEEDTEAEAAE